MNIGVATTVWGSYGRYLPEWVISVAAQTVPPAVVTIVDAGAAEMAAARAVLEETYLNWRIIPGRYRPGGMGRLRNQAVEATNTDWVMHLDADDLLMPHCLADAAGLSDTADVVAVGAFRDGRPLLFTDTCRDLILSGRQAAMSPSPFRRELWERRPYITCNDWVESALWVGFAHLGARFAATKRPGFIYRRHRDSHSARMTGRDKRQAIQQLMRLCRQWPEE